MKDREKTHDARNYTAHVGFRGIYDVNTVQYRCRIGRLAAVQPTISPDSVPHPLSPLPSGKFFSTFFFAGDPPEGGEKKWIRILRTTYTRRHW